MSGDPAIAAAQRAWDEGGQGHGFPHATEADLMIDAAREALAPLRELHRPFTVRTNDDESWVECHSCVGQDWPCPDALHLYSTDELEGTSDAQ